MAGAAAGFDKQQIKRNLCDYSGFKHGRARREDSSRHSVLTNSAR